jgi:glycyl-tRNA synthetase beta chain
MAELLLEIGLEEIPARMITAAEAELARRVADLLTRERLTLASLITDGSIAAGSIPANLVASGQIPAELTTRSYSTPRRLAVHITGVAEAQADTEEQLTGPAWNIAFKDGTPTPAAHAFAKKAGIAVDALQKATTPKGEYVSATAHRPGRRAADLLAAELPKEISAIAWPKNMYWRPGKPERYVRPVKWLLALLDHAILPVEFAGVHASNLTYGHRILFGSNPVTIDHPGDYLPALEAAKVLPDVAARRHKIRKDLDKATRTVTDASWREDEPLLENVTHLTEWPSVVLGSFEQQYLELPEEVLVTVMRDHQKYFAVEDKSGKLTPHFLAVLNTEADQAGLEVIRHGNERVLRARFNDARFFWDFDQKIPLGDRVELLKSVTFQKDLGNYHTKSERTRAIALQLAMLVAERGTAIDTEALSTAAELAKTDLTSELVKEFTELQGIVGGLYARAQGLGDRVAKAIYAQYQPASTTDPIPPTLEGQLLGLAERIGTIVDMFSLGLIPSGSKDPYALRRAAIAIIKILAEGQVNAPIHALLTAANSQDDLVTAFLRERLAFYLAEVQGISFDVSNAVLAASADDVSGTVARARALSAVRNSDDFAAISAAFKRSKNILKQASEKYPLPAATSATPKVEPNLLTEPAEQSLHTAAEQLRPQVESLRQQHNYAGALEQIATLRPHVDLFFDQVMVMVDDEALRTNRLALLALITNEFSRIADFSEIVQPGIAQAEIVQPGS